MAITLNETTLAAAVGAADTKITLTSGATVQPGQVAYVDRECMRIQGNVDPAGTVLTSWYVHRGWSGTQARPHPTAAKCKTGNPAHFQVFSPHGAASAATEVALPWVNVHTGDVFDINAGAWRQIGTGGVLQGTAVWP